MPVSCEVWRTGSLPWAQREGAQICVVLVTSVPYSCTITWKVKTKEHCSEHFRQRPTPLLQHHHQQEENKVFPKSVGKDTASIIYTL